LPTTCIINGWFKPTYENPRGFSIRFLFAKLGAWNTPLIIHKTVGNKLKKLRMKNKLLLLLLIIGTSACAQKIESKKFELTIDKSIKEKVESKIEKSEYSNDFGELLIYQTPKTVDYFVNDSLTYSAKGNETDLFKSFYYQMNDTISIDGAFGLFGGFGFSIKIIDKKPLVYTLMAADEIPIYSLTKSDSLELRIEVPCKNVKLILSGYPKLKSDKVIYGYLEFESSEFYQGEPTFGRKETKERTKLKMNMKVYFKSKYLDIENMN